MSVLYTFLPDMKGELGWLKNDDFFYCALRKIIILMYTVFVPDSLFKKQLCVISLAWYGKWQVVMIEQMLISCT